MVIVLRMGVRALQTPVLDKFIIVLPPIFGIAVRANDLSISWDCISLFYHNLKHYPSQFSLYAMSTNVQSVINLQRHQELVLERVNQFRFRYA